MEEARKLGVERFLGLALAETQGGPGLRFKEINDGSHVSTPPGPLHSTHAHAVAAMGSATAWKRSPRKVAVELDVLETEGLGRFGTGTEGFADLGAEGASSLRPRRQVQGFALLVGQKNESGVGNLDAGEVNELVTLLILGIAGRPLTAHDDDGVRIRFGFPDSFHQVFSRAAKSAAG